MSTKWKIPVDTSTDLRTHFKRRREEDPDDPDLYGAGELSPEPVKRPRFASQNSVRGHSQTSSGNGPTQVQPSTTRNSYYHHPPQYGRMNTGPRGAARRVDLHMQSTQGDSRVVYESNIAERLYSDNSKSELVSKCMYYYRLWKKCEGELAECKERCDRLESRMEKSLDTAATQPETPDSESDSDPDDDSSEAWREHWRKNPGIIR